MGNSQMVGTHGVRLKCSFLFNFVSNFQFLSWVERLTRSKAVYFQLNPVLSDVLFNLFIFSFHLRFNVPTWSTQKPSFFFRTKYTPSIGVCVTVPIGINIARRKYIDKWRYGRLLWMLWSNFLYSKFSQTVMVSLQISNCMTKHKKCADKRPMDAIFEL